MYRRRVLHTAGVALAGVVAGCSGGSTEPTDEPGGSTATPSATATATQTDGDGGLPTEEMVGTAAEEFTPVTATPMGKSQFMDTYDEILQTKDLRTGWVTYDKGDYIRYEYVANNENQEERMRKFAEAYVELTRRTGGTGWRAVYGVQRSDGEVAYTWQIQSEWAVSYLQGDITEDEFYGKIKANVQQT